MWLTSIVIALAAAEAGGTPALPGPEKAWAVLEAGSQEKSSSRRSYAVLALGVLRGNARARLTAERALKDSKAEVRASAAAALAEMRAAASIPRLREALADPDLQVVLAAAHALYELRDPAAYEVYYAVLTGDRKGSPGLVRTQMKELQDPKAAVLAGLGFVPFGGYGVTLFKMLSSNTSAKVRATAAEVLAKDRDPASGRALVQALKDKEWLVRAAALRALARRDDPSFLPGVEAALVDERHEISYIAAAAIIHLSRKRAAHAK